MMLSSASRSIRLDRSSFTSFLREAASASAPFLPSSAACNAVECRLLKPENMLS